MKEGIIQLRDVVKEFPIAHKTVRIIKGVNLSVDPGEFVMVFGPSGCGKSTLLNIMNGWIEPTEGTVLIDGVKIYELEEDKRAKMKRGTVSLMYQSASWIKALSVIDNIAIPNLLDGKSKKEAHQRAMELLKILHLDRFAYYKPVDLSGGQQQRISLLRALISNPKIIMADEPTGNLDSRSTKVIMDLFSKINRELGRTVIMVTHNNDITHYATKVVRILDGQIIEEQRINEVEHSDSHHGRDVLDLHFEDIIHETDQEEEEEQEMAKVQG